MTDEELEKLTQEVDGQIEQMSVDAETSLAEAAHLMITHNLRCIPVIAGKRMIGTVRIQDIFQHVAHETE